MSRIHSVNQNYQQKTVSLKQNKSWQGQNPSFGAGAAAVEDLNKLQQNVVWEALIKKHLGKTGAFFNMLSRTSGEIQNIMIIGLGTAFVAPLFIANNPLSKEDKKSKQYSAWRQPISAVISTAFSFAANYSVNKWFDKTAKNGNLAKFDMSGAWPESYIKDKYNSIKGKLAKGKSIDKLSKSEKEIMDLIKDSEATTKDAFNTKFPTYQDFMDAVHTVTKTNKANELLNPANEKGLRHKTVKDFLVEKLDFKLSDKNEKFLNPDDVDIKFKEVKAMDFLRECGMKDIDEKQLRAFINNNIYRNACEKAAKGNTDSAERMFAVIKEYSEHGDINLTQKDREVFLNNMARERGFNESERKTITRLCESLLSQEQIDKETISLKSLLKVLEMDENFASHERLGMTMDKFLAFLDEAIQPEKLKGKKPVFVNLKGVGHQLTEAQNEKVLKYAIQIVENGAKKAAAALKSYGKFQGIVVSLIVLPPSCTLLNWAYPRIMEKFFPNLAASKAQAKGGK